MNQEEDTRQAEAATAEFEAVYATRATEREQRSTADPLRIVSLILIFIAALLIILLMLDLWGPIGSTARTDRRSIEAVPGKQPIAGTIAVWTEAGNVEDVLSAAGVSHGEVTDLGQGRFVIEVAEGTEAQSVKALKGRPSVNDAGYVYDSESSAEAPTTP